MRGRQATVGHCLAHGHMLRLTGCKLHVLATQLLSCAVQVISLPHKMVSSSDPVQEQSAR